ncbi:MAG TPA: hypothetical protein VF576_08090 [Rubricoccaceae bacterium]
MRLPTRPLLLAALAVSFSACDSYNNGYDDGYYDGIDDAPTGGATVVDFTLDRDDYEISDDTQVASFESDRIGEASDLADLRSALASAGENGGALVAAYVVTDVRDDGRTYSALPLTRAEDAFVAFDVDNDGTVEAGEGVAYVDYTLAYEYSFDDQDFYFDVVSSARGDTFPGGEEAFFDAVISDDIEVRVVTVPADEFNRSAVDMTDYAAVAAAYNLPD